MRNKVLSRTRSREARRCFRVRSCLKCSITTMMIIIIKIARVETAITVPRHPTATLTILTHHLSYYERISRRYRNGKVHMYLRTLKGEEESACQNGMYEREILISTRTRKQTVKFLPKNPQKYEEM